MALSFACSPHLAFRSNTPRMSTLRNVIRINSVAKNSSRSICNSRLNNIEKKPEISSIDMKKISHSLHQIIPRIYKDPGVALMLYDDCSRFRDPLTSIDSLHGFLRYLEALQLLFQNEVQLHYVKQTGPYEITMRWTTVMKFMILPWKPELVLTGISIMNINPNTHKFCSHVDIWDSIKKNEYFSLEGLWHIIQQLHKTPDLESPKYQVLKRTANYEVRKYSPLDVVGTEESKLSGSMEFDEIAWSGGIMAVSKFSEEPTEDVIRDKERALRSLLLEDRLKPGTGWLLARQNGPCHIWSMTMRNEVLIRLEDFTLE